ncbi:hypothetical protein FG386_003527 [Cryptosporidium ryanae]|uniref:uncharacterized protein n=1 Tax=Cryptosporidium ryanae TaxID=515981 RepID=UPI00351A2DDF|nr:hypothetical protein FG386_003527 [Cryptosporidium ryanae]
MGKGAFYCFGFSPKILEAIKLAGYSVPTPIQRKCFPSILAGRDVIAMARTGSGKTASFVLPMIEKLGCTHSHIVGIRGLILSPTRELALQTYRVVRKLSCKTDLIVCAITGGSSLDRQFESLSGNPDIVVATPGRLYHHIIEVGLSLRAVKMVVLDEADRLFEMSLLDQVEKILETIPINKQCILVSATIPTELVSFSRAKLKEPEIIKIDSDYILSETLELAFLFVREDEKLASLLFLLRNTIPIDERVIVFCATKHHVEYISKVLQLSNVTVSYIYGNMDQEARVTQLNCFRKSKSRVLVVTDIAARGVDIPMIKFVINYDYPLSPKLFVHRTGRTARAGQFGKAISLITMRDLPYTLDLCLFIGIKLMTINEIQKKITVNTNTHPNKDGESSEKNTQISFENQDNQNSGKSIRDFSSNVHILASFPDLSLEIESIERLLTENAEIERSRRSMESSYSLYLKTRTPSSKESVKRSKDLIEDCGGASNILMTVHPILMNEYGKSSNDKQYKLGLTTNDPLLNFLKVFRPSSVTNSYISENPNINCNTGKAILKSSAKMKKISDVSKIIKHITKNEEYNNLDKNESLMKDFKQEDNDDSIISIHKKRKPKKQGSKSEKHEQIFIPYSSEQAISRSVGLQIEGATIDINPDEEAEIKKNKSIRKWNSIKKKYEIIDESRQKFVKTNESGIKVRGELKSTGQYKKWKANTNMKIQTVGEIEDLEITNRRKRKNIVNSNFNQINKHLEIEENPPILNKHKCIVEAINTGKKLTHKQTRIAKKIGIINYKSKVKNIKSFSELKSPQEIIRDRSKNVKKRMKNDPEFRKKQLLKCLKKFNEKNASKVVRKSRPNRSKMIIIKKNCNN